MVCISRRVSEQSRVDVTVGILVNRLDVIVLPSLILAKIVSLLHFRPVDDISDIIHNKFTAIYIFCSVEAQTILRRLYGSLLNGCTQQIVMQYCGRWQLNAINCRVG